MNDASDIRKIMVYARIYDAQTKPMLPTEHIDAPSSTSEVDHLLPRNVAWTDTDVFTLNAVIASKQQVTRVS